MKKIQLIILYGLMSYLAFAQNGMDHVLGSPTYAKLSTPGVFNPFNPNSTNGWEKLLGVYQAGITPRAYLEVNTTAPYMPAPYTFTTFGFGFGEVFRTYSPVDGIWRMFYTNPNSNTDLQAGALYSSGNGADFNIEASRQASGSIIFKTPGISSNPTAPPNEKMRIVGNNSPQQGYIGLNNNGPVFHMDMVTPAITNASELFYSGRPSDVPGSRVGFFNATVINSRFIPTSFGYVDATQAGPGYETIGSIDPSQDLSVNNNSWAITRFVSGKGLVTNLPFQFPAATPISSVSVRNLFSWSNSDVVNMIMNVDGRVRVMNNMAPVVNTAPVPPGNRLEITCSPGDPYFTPSPPNGASGLRLTNMTTTSTPVPLLQGQGVLSVDAFGDVIYVQSPTVTPGSVVGNYCAPGPSNPLTGDYEVPLGGFRYYFPGQNPASNNQDIVSVGYNCGSNPPARFSALEAQTPSPVNTTYAGHFQNNDVTGTTSGVITGGVYGETKGTITVLSSNPQISAGGVFEADNSWSNIGVCGRILSTSVPLPVTGPSRYSIGGAFMSEGVLTNPNLPTQINNFGVYAKAANAPVANFGVYAEAVPNSGISTSYAVFAKVGINHNTGLGGDLAGYFDGDVYTTSNGYYQLSDKNFKKDIKSIEKPMDIINKLNPVTYTFDKDGNKQMNLSSGLQYGFISQEVKEILPQFTKTVLQPTVTDESGNELAPQKEVLSLNYIGFIAILTKGMQEQQAQIEEQKKTNDNQQKQIDELKAMVQAMASNSSDAKQINSQPVELSDKNTIVLNQNVPNPFAESTVINYNILSEFSKAQIIFSTSDGKVIKTVDVTTQGKGQLNVFANDLSSGIYTYTLVVDGKTIDTKRMMKN